MTYLQKYFKISTRSDAAARRAYTAMDDSLRREKAGEPGICLLSQTDILYHLPTGTIVYHSQPHNRDGPIELYFMIGSFDATDLERITDSIIAAVRHGLGTSILDEFDCSQTHQDPSRPGHVTRIPP